MAEILDKTDLQILKTLQKNAKLTTKELANAAKKREIDHQRAGRCRSFDPYPRV